MGRGVIVFFVVLLLPLLASAQYRLYEEGIKKYNEKDYYAAIELFSDFLTKPLHDKKFDADTYYWRGLSAFKLNDFDAAEEDLAQALVLNHPNSGNIHWFLAKSLDKLAKHDKALESYTSAIKLLEKDKTKKAQLLTERAQVYTKLNKNTEAQQDLKDATSLAPDIVQTELAKNTTVPVTEKKEEKKQEPILAKNDAKKETPGKTTDQKKKDKSEKPALKEEKKEESVAKNEPENTNAQDRKTNLPVSTSVPVSVPVVSAEPTLADIYKDEKRYALVIGNSAYPKQIGVLKNPVNDATDFAASLKKLGFDVTLITDASYGKIRAEMMKFRDKLNLGEEDKTIGLFYYAGHGLQNDNENYIVPVDAELQYQDDIPRYCFPIQKMVLSQMENTNSRMNIVILDACRNNPFPSLNRGIGEAQGLGELKKARGAFIAYATSPGSVASDGTGRNGLYTQELIKAMNRPNRTIEQVFKEVRANVLKISADRQNPWENSNIIGDFYFKLD